ncbi:hypothetical protein CONLIGDRAFT_703167 [Coniochaeta ligniaria NRRL 30616]|uniref:Single-strand DNA deaminase toxin A-like C-terminal domain-containing protein n=1 Tax=Coniochaeta ligniaria NRRL 30616 TaxID=1408157 RepID=A0A1J7ILZ3_9PEZI|nr:hypothetical protein CONLIGDRAFT_703167 [Coniochaeta ligniaria NRRL 30616]
MVNFPAKRRHAYNDGAQTIPSQRHPRQQRAPDSPSARHRVGVRHHHGLGGLDPDGSLVIGQTRAAHCPCSSYYQLCYPFEEKSKAQYSYMIDKASGLFVTVGVELPNDAEDEGSTDVGEEDDHEGEGEEVKEANRDFRSLRAGQDDSNRIQLQTIEDQLKRLDIGDAQNTRAALSSLLETYKNDPFVSWRGKDDVNCIAPAAVQGHHKMIRFLHDKGGDLNNVDSCGRTPLMEAALWGRLEVVNLLLERGADPRATDRKGRNAYFHSRPSKMTARMREKFGHYQESGEGESNRRIIAVTLQSFEPVTMEEETASSSLLTEPKHGLLGTEIGFYEESIAYDVPDRRKTVARLDRGRLFPIVSGASGWRTDFSVEHVLDNRLWRDRVLELCQLVGYALPEDYRDESGRSGSYNASHAEKKLVAFYNDQHVIVPREFFGVDLPGEWMQQDLKLQHLRTLCPAMPTVRANIKVSRPICDDCKLFISQIGTLLGARFTIGHC